MSIATFASSTELTLPEVDVTATRLPAAVPQQNLWLRSWNLSVGKPTSAASGPAVIGIGSDPATSSQDGGAFDLSDFHFTFTVKKKMGGEPWSLEAKIYNVPDKLAQQIANQFTNVSLVVGYALPQPKTDASGAPAAVVPPPQGYKPGGSMLFSGDVVWYEKGREQNITDTFLTIYANSFDPAQNSSVVNTLLKARRQPKGRGAGVRRRDGAGAVAGRSGGDAGGAHCGHG